MSNPKFDVLKTLQDLVSIPGPPGQEELVCEYLKGRVGAGHRVDAKGNLIIGSENPTVVVMAHMDEIAMIVQNVQLDGTLTVRPLGGLNVWKLGEGPVSILATNGSLNGVLSFGSVHTEDPSAVARQAESESVDWDVAVVMTGLGYDDLLSEGVRPGTRVVVHPSRRTLTPLGELISGHFLDDRADLVSWLLALDMVRKSKKGWDKDLAFVATVSEETGGEGALYYLAKTRPDVCIALELGPNVPDAQVEISDQPTVWAGDSYSMMTAADGDLVDRIGGELEMELQFQMLSRGGSDASCAASHGLCARPITLGLPMENSHGYEIIHPGSVENLALLTARLIEELI